MVFRLKYYLRNLLITPFVPFILLKKIFFGTPSELIHVTSTIEKVLTTKISAIDIGDVVGTEPTEYFFHSNLQQTPFNAQLMTLAIELGISCDSIRMMQDVQGVVIVLDTPAMKKIQTDC